MLALIAVNSLVVAAPPEPRQARFSAVKGSHRVTLDIATRAFSASAHRISYASPQYLASHHYYPPDVRVVLRIDGRTPLGTDGDLPKREIVRMAAVLDGVPIEVPRNLIADCYEPHLDKSLLAVRIGDDNQSVFVFMNGSDAAGSYQVVWVLSKTGFVTRFSGACSDCGFLDFQSGFFDSASHKAEPVPPETSP